MDDAEMMKKNRLLKIQKEVADISAKLQNDQQYGIIHLACVSSLCGLIGKKRKLDSEICQTAGLLHDLWLYCNFPLDIESHKKHGLNGSIMAREILQRTKVFEKKEINLICQMISSHDNKDEIGSIYDEVLKDADAFDHFLRNTEYDAKYRFSGRQLKLAEELGIEID